IHYGARYYDPTTGTFTQQDSLDAPLDPLNANRYAYAGNDPINNTDPTGYESLSACLHNNVGKTVLGGLAGGAIAGIGGGPAGMVSGAVLGGLGGFVAASAGCGYDAITPDYPEEE
ncbi:RHS repeat-associated core domain-containing protein, partial [Auraticoccus cholistanensis]|uniref:RHS repeat-associated core domain-containing protein n=1 Tax=Auraticoccus cholistanensis TaxID=2656650 RepID=UPI002F915DCF